MYSDYVGAKVGDVVKVRHGADGAWWEAVVTRVNETSFWAESRTGGGVIRFRQSDGEEWGAGWNAHKAVIKNSPNDPASFYRRTTKSLRSLRVTEPEDAAKLETLRLLIPLDRVTQFVVDGTLGRLGGMTPEEVAVVIRPVAAILGVEE